MSCDYCYEDFDDYVKPLDKNGHAYLYYDVEIGGKALHIRYGKMRELVIKIN